MKTAACEHPFEAVEVVEHFRAFDYPRYSAVCDDCGATAADVTPDFDMVEDDDDPSIQWTEIVGLYRATWKAPQSA